MSTTTTSGIGSGKPLRSASAIVAGTESGQHLLKIVGYSRITKHVPTGSHIKSRYFHVGGNRWQIEYYPNGYDSRCSDYISILFRLDYCGPNGVTAQLKIDLLDHQGKPVKQYSRTRREVKTFISGWGWCLFYFIKRDELEKSTHLRDDSFTIRCDVTVMKEFHSTDIDVDSATPRLPPQPPAVVVPPPALHHHLGSLLKTGEAADMTFEVNSKTFPAHRCVISARSPVFYAQLSGLQANETAAINGGGAVIRIEDMEAQDFEAFLHYVYTDTLPEMNKENDGVAMLPDLIAAANRYMMERLRLICEEKLCEYVNVRTVAAMLTFAGEYQCHGLKEMCLRFLDDPGNLREVVKVNNGLRNLSPSVLQDLIAKLIGGLPSNA